MGRGEAEERGQRHGSGNLERGWQGGCPRNGETEAGQKGRKEGDESVEEGKRKAGVVRGGMEAGRRGARQIEEEDWSEKGVEGSRQDRETAVTRLFGFTQAGPLWGGVSVEHLTSTPHLCQAPGTGRCASLGGAPCSWTPGRKAVSACTSTSPGWAQWPLEEYPGGTHPGTLRGPRVSQSQNSSCLLTGSACVRRAAHMCGFSRIRMLCRHIHVVCVRMCVYVCVHSFQKHRLSTYCEPAQRQITRI